MFQIKKVYQIANKDQSKIFESKIYKNFSNQNICTNLLCDTR